MKSRKIRKSLTANATMGMGDKKKGERWAHYGVLTGAGIMLAGFGIWAVTGKPQPGVKVLAAGFWLAFASLNAETFFSGRIRRKSGVTITRDASPGEFYLAAITFTVVSMAFSTFIVWAAFFG
jgi:hypothetical protein